VSGYSEIQDQKFEMNNLLHSATQCLIDAGIDTPLLDSQLLMSRVLCCSRLDIITHPERILSDSEISDYLSLVEKRASRYPLAYILGRKEFYGIEIEVSPVVLIPRPETEILVEQTIKLIVAGLRPSQTDVSPVVAGLRPSHLVIADIGLGSGAIAIALAANIQHAKIYGTEISDAAMEVARANIEKQNLSDRVTILSGDLLDPLAGLELEFDAIVSNPPYIPTGEIDSLQPEVSLFEPREALDGGHDGLDIYRKLVPSAMSLLKVGGFIAVEVGAGQAPSVGDIARQSGYRDVAVVPDLAGIERVVIAYR